MSIPRSMKNTFDTANFTAAVSYIAATFAGMSISEWAAVAALVYSLMLIAEKAVALLQRFKAWRASRRGA